MKFGLIGYPLEHSFSPRYFARKFEREKIQAEYALFPLRRLDELKQLITNHTELKGLNVTIPYKEEVIRYLNDVDEAAKAVGAVNTISIRRSPGNIFLKGFNTDVYGFVQSLKNFIPGDSSMRALVLGTGGAAKAVRKALEQSGIAYLSVSRNADKRDICYDQLEEKIIRSYLLIINTTPLGMYPKVNEKPPIPYHLLSTRHYCYDLIYNPENTAFMKASKYEGAKTKNGLEMLHLQAEKSWEIWNR